MRRNVVLLILLIIVIGVVSFLFVFRPQANKISDTAAQADAARQRGEELQLELDRLEALREQAPQLRERAAVLDAAMPTVDPKLAEFILQVQDAATTSGIEWISISPTPPTPATGVENVSQVAVALSIEGGYFQVQDFLVRLETLSRAVKIGTVSLSPSELPILSSSLSMQIFVSTAPATPAPAPAATPGG